MFRTAYSFAESRLNKQESTCFPLLAEKCGSRDFSHVLYESDHEEFQAAYVFKIRDRFFHKYKNVARFFN